jgi:hypothetical protein
MKKIFLHDKFNFLIIDIFVSSLVNNNDKISMPFVLIGFFEIS